MIFKKLIKKITAGITAAAVGLTLTFSAPAQVEAASSWLDVAGTLISAGVSYDQMNKQFKALNDTEEGRMQLYQQFQKKTGVNNNHAVNARMDKIMADLTQAVGQVDHTIYDKPYKYYVSADQTLNAFCSLGHVMVVNIGAFNLLSTDDEIAAIIGHEMGHGQKDHVIKGNRKQLQKLVIAQLGAVAAGGGAIATAVATLGAKGSVAHGNRKLETEADNLGWEYILHTNYNIGAPAAVMQKLWELGGKKKGGMFAGHPDTDKRRDNYANKLYEYSGKRTSAENGVVKINGKIFMTVAATDYMSSEERSYFILGNLAKAYHNGKNYESATVTGGTVYLGDQAIVTPVYGDEDAYTLAERLNELISMPISIKSDKKSKRSKAA